MGVGGCVCVGSGGSMVRWWRLGGVVLLVGNNVMRLFYFAYAAASHTAHVHYYFSCILTVVIDVTLLSMLPLMLFSLDIENVRECCKVQ